MLVDDLEMPFQKVRSTLGVLGVLIAVLLTAADASAQGASIRGKVADDTGGALPGVSVATASPALLVPQNVVTDAEGNYMFADLPVGRYQVTYELAGFQRLIREDIQLSAGFSAALNVILKVGGVEESVTVSGESPVVDTSSTTNSVNLSAQAITEVIPAVHTLNSFVAMAPGVVPNGRPDLGGGTNNSGSFSAYGISGQLTNLLDGVNTRQSTGTGGNGPDMSSVEEMQVTAVAGGAEQALPGILVNLIVKSGGNQFHGRTNFQGSEKSLQSNNKPAELAAQGVTVGDSILSGFEWTGDVGGRLIRDKFWFYTAYRYERANRTITGYSEGTGPDGLYGTADDIPGTRLSVLDNQTLKLTYQAAKNYKITGFYARNGNHLSTLNGSRTIPFEASQENIWNPNQMKVELQGTPSNRFVFRAFLGLQDYIAQLLTQEGYDHLPSARDNVTLINTGPSVDAVRRPRQSWQPDLSLSFFPGGILDRHEVKAGYTLYRQLAGTRFLEGKHGNYRLIFDTASGVPRQPFQIQTFNNPVNPTDRNNESGIYFQDTWRANDRLTVNLGIRVDRFETFVPPQDRPAGQFSSPASFSRVNTGTWNEPAPRLGVIYDLSGNGKMVIKAHYGVYNHALGDDFASAYNRNTRVTTTYRWRDLNGNRDYDPGEVNLDTNGPDFITIDGAANNAQNPDLKDPHTKEFSLMFERELMPNFGARVSYIKIRQDDLIETINVLRPYSAFNIPISRVDPGPDGVQGNTDDGGTVTVWDFDPAFRGSNFVGNLRVNRPSDRDPVRDTFELVLTKRATGKWGLLGSATLQKIDRNIAGVAQSPNDKFNDVDNTWDWNYKANGNYELPWRTSLSGSLQVYNGIRRQRTYLFRNIPNAGTVTLRMEPYGEKAAPARTLLSLRVTRNTPLRNGHRLGVSLDVLNALNSNSIWTMSDVSGPTYGQINTFTSPRIFRGGITYTF